MLNNYYIRTSHAEVRLLTNAETEAEALREVHVNETAQSGEAHIHPFDIEYYVEGNETHSREVHHCNTCKM